MLLQENSPEYGELRRRYKTKNNEAPGPESMEMEEHPEGSKH